MGGPGSPIPVQIQSSNGSGSGFRARGTTASTAVGAIPHSWPSSNYFAAAEVDAEVELPAHSRSYSGPAAIVAVEDAEQKPQASGTKHSFNSATSDQLLSNSASDEEQTVVDERRQRRMLSNRESARRSRLRKQQHLDELRAQVALLRGENNQIIAKYGVATQRYAQISEENRVLRSHAMDLSRQLQRLHHTATAHHPGGLLPIN